MRSSRLAAAVFAALALLAPPVAAESHCWNYPGPTQYFDALTICASSVLPDQQGNTYGPRNLQAGRDKAWCEGAQGDGVGEEITVHFRPSVTFRTIRMENGYQKSQKSYAENGRVARVEITAGDLRTVVTLHDQAGVQAIRLPRWVQAATVRIRILGTYAGKRYADTCLSGLWFDLEEFDLLSGGG